ncbi:MAG: hypothetical protein ACREEL_06995 [Stellaceae bacterium]
MDGIVKLAATVLAEISALERARTVAPYFALAAVFVLLALAAAVGVVGCGIAALWIALLPAGGPWGAPLICAGVLLCIAAALLGGGYWLLRGRDRPKTATSALAAALESGDFAPLVREHKWLLIALALMGGLTAAGKLSKSRRD